MYADVITDSMKNAMDETARRRTIQRAYNQEHGIVPQSIRKAIAGPLVAIADADYLEGSELLPDPDEDWPDAGDIPSTLTRLKKEMKRAATALEFERAAELRDRIHALERHALGLVEGPRA